MHPLRRGGAETAADRREIGCKLLAAVHWRHPDGLNAQRLEQLIHMPVAVAELVQFDADLIQ
jgi:hypothetical protein